MDRIENKEGIVKIIMRPTAVTKCAIGQDWYKHEFEVFFVPGACYPDYMQVEKWIMDEIDGKELNIEEAVAKLYDMLEQEYTPEQISIKDRIRGNKVHFDVIVQK